MGEKIVSVQNLQVFFPVEGSLFGALRKEEKKFVKAVDGVSLEIERGQIVALVGESGCGKTTIARSMVGLQRPTNGTVEYQIDGQCIRVTTDYVDKDIRKHVQYIFQDPYSSLNPRMKVKEILERPMECLKLHKEDRQERLVELANLVGLSEEHLERYPHEFSGGQKQRISIARALAAEPDIIIADEPTAALDVSIQGQILNLLLELRDKLNLTMLFVTHDLGVVRQIADRVVVMYLGQIVETGDVKALFANPMHPYTRPLLDAMPAGPAAEKRERERLTGSIPSPINPPPGCRLQQRCPRATALCSQIDPPNVCISEGRNVRCHLFEDK